MRSVLSCRWGPLVLAILLLILCLPTQAAITPQSDVLLPWFEVDLTRQDEGLATTFSVVNDARRAVDAKLTVYTNWGIPVLEVPLQLKRGETFTALLHEWIMHGRLPDRTLTAIELANLQAMLTGKPSPIDSLYYSSEFKPDIAVGYAIVQTLGDRPDSLWGDTYSVDPDLNYFEAETLTALDHDLKADCDHHGLRFNEEGILRDADEMIIWSGHAFSPSRTPDPVGQKVHVKMRAYDRAGVFVHEMEQDLIAVQPLQVCDLKIMATVGWLEVMSEDPTFILQHIHSTTKASAELHSYCLPAAAQQEGPSISLKKKVDGFDADNPPGPRFAAGAALPFQFEITNDGTVALIDVVVKDDEVSDLACPNTTLGAGETMVCTASGIAAPCLGTNVATVSGRTATGQTVTAIDAVYYTSYYEPALQVELLVNGNPADDPTGPVVSAGDPLQWTYVITNSGNARLTGIRVSNKKAETVTCPKSELEPGETMTCSAETLAAEGQRHEIATAKAADPCDTAVVGTDPAYYFGRANRPSIVVQKYIGESDADTPPGPTLRVGTTIQWRYIVTNTGDVPLDGIVLSDDDGTEPACPKSALAPGESMLCTASGLAVACQHSNTATVRARVTGEGDGEGGRSVHSSDTAYYFGQGHPAVVLELTVNGEPADVPPGPWFDEGATLLLTFEVTNTGDVPLTDLIVSDDADHAATCPKTSLQPGATMSCTINALAAAGTHDLFGSVTGRGPCGDTVNATDPAYYRGRVPVPGIDLVKLTNGIDVSAPPGPMVAIGSTVQWTYVVTNSGTVALTNVAVADDHQVVVTCPKATLDVGESMTCTASGLAQPCQYTNTATVTGQPPAGSPVTDSDTSYYFGEHHASISIVKEIHWEARAAEVVIKLKPAFTTGATINWKFTVTNSGDVPLTDVVVTDDRTSPVSCPKTALAVGESMTCTATGIALSGSQTNVATVTGKPPCGNTVSDSDSASYKGVTPAITLKKLINGEDADDTEHAVQVGSGTEVLWSFVVTNSGDVGLNGVSVIDAGLPTIICPADHLEPGEAMTCTASALAVPGSNCNTGKAVGTSPQDVTVESTDSACYFGRTDAGITIQKLTNDLDVAAPTGPHINVGQTVQWKYIVTNTGNVTLDPVTVTDDKGVTVTCPKTALAPAESMTCTASGTAIAGQYTNIGTASGRPPTGDPVTASDPSYYFGDSHPGLSIVKSTNGNDANTTPGPYIPVGNAVQWTYVVTNTGDVVLTNVAVTDDKGVVVTCPKTTLQPAESMTCTASGIATAGQYANVGTVTASGATAAAPLTASDPSHYFGSAPAITIEKATNGHDADTPPGPQITVGSAVQWSYVVTNTGNVPLSAVTVTDDKGVVVTCPKTSLQTGESMTCTASGVAVAGQYANVGTVAGTATGGGAVSASDPSHYLGVPPASQGCTPGYWKNHTDSWPPTGYSPTQSVGSVFSNASIYSLHGFTLLDSLGFSGGAGNAGAAEILLRAATAALLNASSPGVSYPRTPVSVTTDTSGALATNNRDSMLALAAALDADNNLGCPLN